MVKGLVVFQLWPPTGGGSSGRSAQFFRKELTVMKDARQDRSATRRPVVDLPAAGDVLHQLFDRLTGEESALWLMAARRFLRKEEPWGPFPTWKTVEFGLYGLPNLKAAVSQAGFHFDADGHAEDVLGKVKLRQQREMFELVIVSVAQLNLEGGVTIEEVYRAAQDQGLALCPRETAAVLCAKGFRGRSKILRFAMQPVAPQQNMLCVLSVDYNELGVRSGDPEFPCGLDDLWVFCRPVSARTRNAEVK